MKDIKIRSVAENQKKAYLFMLRYIISAFLIFLFAFILLRFPLYSAEGIRRGTDICLNTLIPSLYPFMILTDIYVSSSVSQVRIPFSDKLCRFLFRLPGSCAAVIIFSFFGGLPIGASMSSELYERGVISKEQCARMLCFCVNPGPAFVISAVGAAMLGSAKTGVLVYLSLIISSVIMGIASRFFASEQTEISCDYNKAPTNGRKDFSIEKSVVKCSKALFEICAFVTAFSCLTALAENINIPDGIRMFILCTAEMTKGSLVAAESYPVPIVAAVIGFSGFCGHLQLNRAIRKSGLKYKHFIVSRVINSGLSAVICSILLKLFPVAEETFAIGAKPQGIKNSGSAVLSVLMIIMAILFVIGDDYKVSKKEKKKV